jgi:hypothetical protein
MKKEEKLNHDTILIKEVRSLAVTVGQDTQPELRNK